ncbi:VOC family protein [Micromonospora craniellae]|uniref:VOC family protein n=1 Tax=Micromonospora craniellae TaxID=2294034 RepID=UPI001CC3F799|nr:VOC family protein [Micromonospora craniellae]
MGSSEGRVPPVRQLRLVVEADDYEAAVRFYRDVLGLPEQAAYSGGDGAEVVILDAGRATLEIANPAQKRMIDDVEVGRQVAPRIRVAFEVDDAQATTERLVAEGASEVAPPTTTPWQSAYGWSTWTSNCPRRSGSPTRPWWRIRTAGSWCWPVSTVPSSSPGRTPHRCRCG